MSRESSNTPRLPEPRLLPFPCLLSSVPGQLSLKAYPPQSGRRTPGEKMDQFHDSPGQACQSDTDLLRIVFQGKWRLKVLREIVKGPTPPAQTGGA